MSEYRQYENADSLEKGLDEMQKQMKDNPSNIDLAMDIDEMKQRINYAWQDNEDFNEDCELDLTEQDRGAAR